MLCTSFAIFKQELHEQINENDDVTEHNVQVHAADEVTENDVAGEPGAEGDSSDDSEDDLPLSKLLGFRNNAAEQDDDESGEEEDDWTCQEKDCELNQLSLEERQS